MTSIPRADVPHHQEISRHHRRRGLSGRPADPGRLAGAVAGRVPPHDLDAEAAVLSAVMLDADALDRVLELLCPEHFYSDANRVIFEACVSLADRGAPVDIVSVAARLRDAQRLAQVGGSRYLAQLVDATPAVAHVAAHACVVREKWRLRKLIATCQRFAAEGYGDMGSVQHFIDAAEQEIYQIARTPEATTVKPLHEVMTSAFEQLVRQAERGDRLSGTPTGYADLDRLLCGLHVGELLIIAARPGMGKTALVLNLAVNVATGSSFSAGRGVALFSLEMPKEQLARRMVCAEARLDLSKLRQGFLSSDEWVLLTEGAGRLASLPMWIDDTPALSLLELRAKVRRLQAEARGGRSASAGHPPGAGQPGGSEPGILLVIVDYLQLMQGRRSAASREQEISEISRGLKQLAKELDVVVIALSQLNRGVETRGGKDKRPMLADLRESGAIEQDADTIIFIYRDDYYNPDTTDAKGLAELIVAKQRNGPTGKVLTRYVASCTRFDSLAPGYQQAGY